jgi:hypothetical protein
MTTPRAHQTNVVSGRLRNCSPRTLRNFRKVEPLIQKLQRSSGISRRECMIFIRRCIQQKPLRSSWTEGEVDQVRELYVANPAEIVIRKVGRSMSSVRHFYSRQGIRIRKVKCDRLSINSLAAAVHMRESRTGF